YFADPLVLFLGGQANSASDEGVAVTIERFSVTGVDSSFSDDFPQDAGLLATPWFNDSSNPQAIQVLPVATPAITWVNPPAMVFGTPLGSNQLNATASAPGSFVYTPGAGTTLPIGSNTLSVAFTPADMDAYHPALATAGVMVNPLPFVAETGQDQAIEL